MRCKACNALMTDLDLKRKDRETGEYVDLCTDCYEHSQEALWEAKEDIKITPDPLTIWDDLI